MTKPPLFIRLVVFLLAASADTLEVKSMVCNGEPVFALQPFFKRQQPIFLDLFHASALYADQMMMVMLAVVRPQVITGYAVAEVQFLHDVHFAQQLQRPVYGSQTNLRRLILYAILLLSLRAAGLACSPAIVIAAL
jgi:hypothetical protein